MKKVIIFLVASLYLGLTSINAQITIRENEVLERPVFKPKYFDSLTNLELQKHPTDYKKYIGYKIYFLPESKNYKSKYSSNIKERIIDFLFSPDTIEIVKEGKIPFEEIALTKVYGDPTQITGNTLKQYNERKASYENIDKEKTNTYLPIFYHEKTDKTDGEIYGEIGTSPQSVSGKYFTILNIEGREPYGTKEFKKLDDVEITNDRKWQLGLRITLRNEENQDILYWIIDQARSIGNDPFFLVPYFEKKRENYLNKNVVLKYSDRSNLSLQNLIDVNTGSIINIKYGEVWTCSDLTFIDSKDSYYLSCFYFLKNGDREVKIKLESNLMKDYFMLESEFIKQEIENKKQEEEKKKEEQVRKKKEQLERAKFKNDCITKWGQKMGGYIGEGKVLLGMNKEMCIASWGHPLSINRTIVKGLTSEQWVYGWGTYLYFDNGVLNAIQD